jgi:ketosteroid isomerase-like protein
MDGILAHHAPDIVVFDVPPPVQSQGIDAYRTSWEQFFPWFGNSGVFELSELHITAGGDVAFCHGLIRCSGTESSGERVELKEAPYAAGDERGRVRARCLWAEEGNHERSGMHVLSGY